METKLLYIGWLLLLCSFVLNVSLIVCEKEDITRLEKEKNILQIENTDLKNRIWYAEQVSYIIETKCGGDKNEYR